MCGIAGRFHPVALSPDPLWHVRADELLAHRGPNSAGRQIDERCELVFRRLSIQDLSPAGDQPMYNEDGTVCVVFNGEIYNFRDLRASLAARGHVFRSTADTEVLVHLYEEHGARMVELLRGMFAFAIYDRPRRRLFLARDRFGIKPLYYAVHGGAWLFASEIKALLAVEGFRPGIDRQACYDYLGLGYVPEPLTAFAEIRALPRGTTLTVTPEGDHLASYYHPEAAPAGPRSLDDAVGSASAALVSAVEQQRVADVPVAALLSGGIDSSLVTAAMCRSGGAGPTTFNVRFPDQGYDETPMARAVSERYGTEHRTLDLDEEAVSPEAILRLLRHFDQPFADTSFIPMYWVAKAIRDQGIVCALSGDGGDEAFGGYARFWRANQLARLMRVPAPLQQVAIHAGQRLAGVTRDWGRQVAKAVHLARAGRADSGVLLAGLSNYLSEEQKEELVRPAARAGLYPVYRHFRNGGPPGVSGVEELSRRMTENLFSVGLPSDMLRKVDMMSMLAGVEVRVPLLDEELVAQGAALPHRLKTDGERGKLVLRGLAREWLPPEVAAHRKQGFGIPIDVMATDRFHEMLADLLLAPTARVRGIADERLLAGWLRLFAQARTGASGGTISRGGVYQRIFIVLALELWLRDQNLSW